jgi:quercetin dioxygenase-like cupin family protein
MAGKPVVRQLSEQRWESWPEEQVAERGNVSWKDLIGASPDEGNNMVMGVVRVRKGEVLKPHRHSEPECYFTMSGRGFVSVDDTLVPVEPGTSIFIPGDARHHIENNEDEDLLILYTFAVADWSQVKYRF